CPDGKRARSHSGPGGNGELERRVRSRHRCPCRLDRPDEGRPREDDPTHAGNGAKGRLCFCRREESCGSTRLVLPLAEDSGRYSASPNFRETAGFSLSALLFLYGMSDLSIWLALLVISGPAQRTAFIY